MKETNQEFEKLLKSKMDELSESVDCFDRIASAAYAKDEQDFSQEGFIISDLETVSSSRKTISIIKWTAVAAAAVVCISIIPATGLLPRFLSNNNGNSLNNEFASLIGEIGDETEKGDFKIIDVPLDYYIKNDVLVTPLFSCPFEASSNHDMNVRIFIRQYEGLYTNQVYAVEYSGTYCEDNIMAAAVSRYRFTEKDMTYLNMRDSNGIFGFAPIDEVVESNFNFSENGRTLYDNSGRSVTLASFAQPMYFKDDDGNIFDVTTDVLYACVERDGYIYDIRTYTSNGIDSSGNTVFGEFTLPDRNDMWERTLFFNGNSTKPDENESSFTRVELFGKDRDSWSSNSVQAVAPLEPKGDVCTTPYNITTYLKLDTYDTMVDSISSFILPPTGLTERYLMLIYLPQTLECYYCRVNASNDIISSSQVSIDPIVNYQQDMTINLQKVRYGIEISDSKTN